MNRKLVTEALMTIAVLIGLVFMHELGHFVVYNLLYPELYSYGLGAWIEIRPEGMTTLYYAISPSVSGWVFAGGLLFTIPAMIALSKVGWGPRAMIVGLVIYGIWEMVFL